MTSAPPPLPCPDIELPFQRNARLKTGAHLSSILAIAQRPDLLAAAANFFSNIWSVPAEAYRVSMREAVANPRAVPQWYVVLRDEADIVAGCGIIANDFHDRTDLTPNLCALFVAPPFRHCGIARALLDNACLAAARMGFNHLYLITDHTDFYERCGWSFLTMVQEDAGTDARMYTRHLLP